MSPFASPVRIRPLRLDEGQLLIRATLDEVNWAVERTELRHAMPAPLLAEYTTIDGSTFGSVAYDARRPDEPIGVAWAKRFPKSHPGFGFVAADVPELTLCVFERERGGAGRVERHLLDAVAQEARRQTLRGLSLSVAAGNPQRRSFARAGFADVPAHGGTDTMFLAFD